MTEELTTDKRAFNDLTEQFKDIPERFSTYVRAILCRDQ
ncbi:Protein of unknown function [Pyronema omphalodes CBS 100304]|uniref:Uncharacterized protein n=1 Tax=Pyronema omphalodes (strain CBS 100304) TaxID=1076935 RepID=U4LE53_PYROM|nr:Protein of unknown function [Pyronema omphalodes CBS 100304]